MAAIDSLLKLVEAQKADGLVVASERVPSLKRGGADVPLSMPRVGHDMVVIFMEDLISPEQKKQLDGQKSLKVEHQLDGQKFTCELKADGGRYVLAFAKARPGAAGAAAPPRAAAPEPVRAAPVAAPQPVARTVAAGPVEQVPEDMLPEPDEDALRNAEELKSVLQRAHWEGAADVIFSAGLPTRVRAGGELREVGAAATEGGLVALFGKSLGREQRARLASHGSADAGFDLQGLRFRVNVFRQQRGLSAAVRPVREKTPTLQELGLPDDFTALVGYPSGLVLFTGPTGSGKSSSLAALVEHVNLKAAKHVVTIEDPIEHVFVPRRALIHQREVGRDVVSFAEGLRAALREAPDIILLGEMRDPETIAAALTAAETGHLVLSTMHAGSAATAVDRIIDGFPGHQQAQVRLQLASALRAVVTQVLVPTTRPPERTVAYEKMLVTSAVAAQIREGRGHQIATAIVTGRNDGMVSLEQTLAGLVRARRVGLEAAMAAAQDPEALRRSL
jgi:twitching motility protein PilT